MKELARKILRGWNDVAKSVEFVKVAEFEARHYNPLNKAVQIGKITDHPGLRIGPAANRNFNLVIVTMAMRVVAFAVDLAVLSFRQIGRVQTVGGGESISSGQMGFHDSPYTSTNRSSVS